MINMINMKKYFVLKTFHSATALLLAIGIFTLAGCSDGGSTSGNTVEPWVKDYAAELVDRELYAEAIKAYEKHLQNPGLSPEVKANIHYLIADIYREKIYDFDSAMAYYLKVKYLDPDTDLKSVIDRKIVECLEKSGRSVDAKRELDKAVSADPSSAGGAVVATIGDRKITADEFEKILRRQLPNPSSMTRDEKISFLKSHLANELMANAAVRKGYDKNPEILNRIQDTRRTILAQSIFQEEIASRANVDPDSISLYYEANKDKFNNEDGSVKPLQEVTQEIFTSMYMQKQQDAAHEYISQLLEAEHVEVFDKNITGAPAPQKAPVQPNDDLEEYKLPN